MADDSATTQAAEATHRTTMIIIGVGFALAVIAFAVLLSTGMLG